SAVSALESNSGGRIEFQVYTETNPPPKDVAPESLVPTQIDPGFYYDRDDFCMIGQCLWTLCLGAFGGIVARRLQSGATRDCQKAKADAFLPNALAP
ncbi:MAG: hypothetical protein ACREHD_16850, partial [Pirellulales bacterium]